MTSGKIPTLKDHRERNFVVQFMLQPGSSNTGQVSWAFFLSPLSIWLSESGHKHQIHPTLPLWKLRLQQPEGHSPKLGHGFRPLMRQERTAGALEPGNWDPRRPRQSTNGVHYNDT